MNGNEMAENHTETAPNADAAQAGEGTEAAGAPAPQGEAPDEHEQQAPAPAPDRAWQQESKPKLSDEERVQGLEPEKLRKIMHDMLLARRFEEKAAEAYALGKIGGFCHLYIGQEAVAVGAIHALQGDDYVMTAYREHVHALQMGLSADSVMAELYGKSTGCSGGKGGSMHMFSKEHNYLGGHGIVGGQVPLALGVAWKIRYRKEARVMQVYLGEAAVNQGAFHESLNM
ncbi:MAG TPA: thiamine pyrophosphate-dependent enzyme, partial [Longimicrobiaceae bacterium]|nr:thiamine pyrophosphate-dependent enzyme [Longimicrobiaceae bacterium]